MDDGIEVSELVHTISLLRRTQEYTPAPLPHSPTELKHLSLLDGIVLLMVMGDMSDVVAVTYRPTAADLTIYYQSSWFLHDTWIPITPPYTAYTHQDDR